MPLAILCAYLAIAISNTVATSEDCRVCFSNCAAAAPLEPCVSSCRVQHDCDETFVLFDTVTQKAEKTLKDDRPCVISGTF